MEKAIQIEYGPLFEYKCECAAKAGFDSIAVNYTQVLGKSENEWKAITEDIARILDKTGLHCHQTHPHYYNLFISKFTCTKYICWNNCSVCIYFIYKTSIAIITINN